MSSSNTLLQGKKVIVIGGSSGIGKGVAAASLANGAFVTIASSSQARVDAAVESLKKDITSNVEVTGKAFNIKDYSALTGFLNEVAPFDHLVITAGETPKGVNDGLPKAGIDIREQLGDTLDSRYWAALNAAHHIHHNKLVNPGGSLTLTIGIVQARPMPGWGFFVGGAMGSLETATRGLAIDLKPLRVNTISPGLVNTEMFRDLHAEVKDKILREHREKLLVGHVGTPDEVAEAYIFAMKCQYLTGQVINVDGGGVLV